jgi:hypothetical protein
MPNRSFSESEALVLKLNGLDEIQSFLAHIISEARKDLSIMTQALEPELLNNESVSRLLAHFARAHARNRVRVITCDTRKAEQRGHRLVTLAQQLPSFVGIRLLSDEMRQAYPVAQRTLVIADNRHGFIWKNLGNPQANGYWHKPALLKSDLSTFDTLWEHSEEVPALRRLGI